MIQRTGGAMIIALFAAGVGLAQPLTSPPAKAGDKPAARVNGVVISHAEVDALVKRLGPSAVPQPEAHRRQVRAEMLALLIEKQLMAQFLAARTPKVTPEEVDRKLKEMEAGLRELKEGSKSLEEFCHDTHQTLDQLKAAVADHVRWSNYVKKHASEEALRAYYQANKEVFDQVTVKASHIVVRLPRGAAEAEASKAMAKLKELRAKIVGGQADFAEMARQYSQDPTAKNGGDLGPPFPRKWAYDEAFSKAAFALKVGEVSDVVRTDHGLHLIKVTERSPGKPTEYAGEKEAVAELFAEELRQDVLNEMHKTAKIEMMPD